MFGSPSQLHDFVSGEPGRRDAAHTSKPLAHQVSEAQGWTDQSPVIQFLEHNFGIREEAESPPEAHRNGNLTLGRNSHFGILTLEYITLPQHSKAQRFGLSDMRVGCWPVTGRLEASRRGRERGAG